ncbi:hypothetical protein AB0L44_04620 [Nonomuraea wenchangensis]|uniref:hypothetical protein n=1 Tax=Nonomuraea wenchangensis TaxID=568860 RepID=UPI003414AA68
MVKGNLIAAGGVLAAAVAIVGLAGPANAGTRCDLGVSDSKHSLGVDAERVRIPSRDAKACKNDNRDSRQSWGKSDDAFDSGFDGGFADSLGDGDDAGFDGDFDDAFAKDNEQGHVRGPGWGWIEPEEHERTWGVNGYRYPATTHSTARH